MAWDSAVADLRIKLSDGEQDRLRSLKPVLGDLNGTNRLFKTFEYRRVSDFTQNAFPFGVYLNQTRLDSSVIANDDTTTGYFELVNAPVDGDELTATYYYQWFTDTECDQFLRQGANWLDAGDDYSAVGSQLRPAALCYAASEAFQKLSLRFVENSSEIYRLEDAPDADKKSLPEQYRDAAAAMLDQAIKLRNDYYDGRAGQALQPIVAFARGRARDVAPSR